MYNNDSLEAVRADVCFQLLDIDLMVFAETKGNGTGMSPARRTALKTPGSVNEDTPIFEFFLSANDFYANITCVCA